MTVRNRQCFIGVIGHVLRLQSADHVQQFDNMVLRHDCQSKIIAIAASVAGLEVVSVHGQNGAVGQVAEGAGNRIGRGVAEDNEDQALL